MKPTNQFGSGIITSPVLTGLSTEIMLGKAVFNSSEIPQFIDVLIATISSRPDRIKCFLLQII